MCVKVTYKMIGFLDMFWTVLDVLIDASAFNARPCARLGNCYFEDTYKMIGFF